MINVLTYIDLELGSTGVPRACAGMQQRVCALGVQGYFTTHSLRRGGAQYRLMYAPLVEHWALSVIRWWGGWAEGKQESVTVTLDIKQTKLTFYWVSGNC